MSLADDFDLPLSVSVAPWRSNDGYHDIYGAAVSHSCAVKYEIREIMKADGTKAITTMQIYLDGAAAIGSRDKITFGGADMKVLRLAKTYDEGEVYSVIIYT